MILNRLQVLTYNIHKGFSPSKLRFQLHKMREALNEINPDLLFLQEVQGQDKIQAKMRGAWPKNSQFEFLADTLWPHYAYAKNAVYQSGHHGNAILSKYPILRWENISLSSQKRASRSLLHAVIGIPNTPIIFHVICIHFGLFKQERSEQFQILVNRIKMAVGENEPLIIAGDFNDWKKNAQEELEKKLDLHEVFKKQEGEYAKTFPAIRPTLQNDRIYYRGIDLINGHCLNTELWRKLSDHIPLFAEFAIPLNIPK